MPTIIDILANPLILFVISVPTFILIGILVGTWLSQPRKPKVLQIIPESGRGIELEVDSEDSVNAYCNPVGNTPPQRFIKRFAALNVIRKGMFRLQNYPLWFARHGTAYTCTIDANNEKIKTPLRDVILNILGKELYDKIPNDPKRGHIKDSIEQSEVGVMIEFPKTEPLTPMNPNFDPAITDQDDPRSQKFLPSVSNDDVRRNDINTFIGAVAHGIRDMLRSEGSGQLYKIIFSIGTGIAIGVILSLIFKWGAPVIYQTAPVVPPVNATG